MTRARICGALTAALLTTIAAGAAAQQHVPLTDVQIGPQVAHRPVEEGTRGVLGVENKLRLEGGER